MTDTRRGWTQINAGAAGLALLAATLVAVGAMLAAATAALALSPPVNTAAPTVSGSTVPGHTLTANRGTWTGSPTTPTYAYQWLLCGASSCSNISGATGATFATPLNYNNVKKQFAVRVTATNSAGGAAATSAQTAAIPEPPAPALSLSGRTVTWPAIPGITQYAVATVRHPDTTRETTYSYITGTHYTPTQEFPGEHVNYGVRASTTSADIDPPWGASEMTLNWPIVGINAGAGWGSTAADTILDGHVNWDRVEVGVGSVAASVDDGFHVLGVVGNTDDGTPLSSVNAATWGATVVDQLEDNPGISIAEAGNEMYFKGGVANPVKYGQMYLAAVNAMATAGIHTKLLFNMWGDFYCGDSSFISCPSNGWSQDSSGRGWLADAVAGVPGLAAAIAANGVSTHPYGAVGTNGADEEGTGAVAGQEAAAEAALGTTPPFYVTDDGYNLDLCGDDTGACSESDQADEVGDAMDAFLSDDNVEGVWWFQAWDYGTSDAWGLLDTPEEADDPAGAVRPAFTVLSDLAQEYGQ